MHGQFTVVTKTGQVISTPHNDWSDKEHAQFVDYIEEIFTEGGNGVFTITNDLGTTYIPITSVDYVRFSEGF